ncbi:MAG: ABC transporter ATP-binding protein/permease, partial [Cellulomonadaceae bacterium]|nr:ABC transporter ATP-binding protein/permease [Cellulomonadaceae bacterium]
MLVKLWLRYLKPYWPAIAILMLLQLLQTLAQLYLPSMNARIIDNGVTMGDIPYIWRTGGQMLLVSLGQVICSICAVIIGSRVAMAFGRDLRAQVFDHVQTFSAEELGKFSAPSLITRTTNDVQQIQQVVMMLFTIMIMAPMMLIGGIAMALREDRGLSLLILVVVPLLGAAIGLILWRMIPYFTKMQSRIDRMNGVLREQITGLRVVRAFTREKTEIERFNAANQGLYDVSLGAGQLMNLAFPLVFLIMNLSSVAVIWFGGHRIDSGGMQVGQLTAFLTYLMQILMSVMMSTMMMVMIPRAAVAANRVGEVLDTEPSIHDPATSVPLSDLADGRGPRGEVTFDHVEFRYPGAEAPVLWDVSFTAEPGQMTAIIGSTGSGKTTILNLIPRLFDVTSGRVLIDGVDVRDLQLEDLGSMIGLIPQKAFLFSGTVRSNMQFSKPNATDDEIWQALRTSQSADFVERLPDELDAPVNQGGTMFSGGQRQRLSIARAVVRRPKIYLFDDSFSALDYATDARLRAALKPVTRDATVIV